MTRLDEATKEFMLKVSGDLHDPVVAQKDILHEDFKTIRQMKFLNKNPSRFGMAYLSGIFAKKTLPGGEKQASDGDESILKIYAELNAEFNREWHDWEPETIWAHVEDKVAGMRGSWKNCILALQSLVTTNQAFEHWHIFENTVNALNLKPVDFATLQPCELDDIARAIYIMKKIRPKEEFETEIFGYIASVAKSSGVVYLPKEWFLDSQTYLDNLVNDLELKEKIEKRAPEFKIKDVDPIDIKIQLLRLEEIKEAVDKEKAYA